MNPFCWNDEEKVRAHVGKLADNHQNSRKHGVFAYSLGDENDTKGSCLTETDLAAYRVYLQEIYGTLEALNASWGTAFLIWADVGLSDARDNDETESLKVKNYPRWFDRQAFKSYNYVTYCEKYASAFAAMDPQAKTGFEGAGSFAHGDDIDLIVRRLKFWSPYPGAADEIVRSIAPRDMPRSNWMGYTKDADSLLQKYWRMVTRGMDSVWWWRWECIGRYHGWLAPDLRPYPAVKEILEDTRAVREGLGDLLLQSRMRDDGIAILYSYPSTFAHKLDEGAGFGDYEKTHVAWHKAIRDLGLQFSYVTDRMLRLGEFDPKRFRILVLPRAEAMGDKEAQVIRDFVEKGGVVIADTRPGIYDNHCKKRVASVLDELFGVRRSGYPSAKTVSSSDKKITAALDPGIVAVAGPGRTSVELEGVSVFILQKVGKGYALLLNGDLNLSGLAAAEVLTRFQSAAKGGLQAASAMFADAPLGAILQKLAGIEATAALSREDGSPMRDVEVIRWVNGKNEIIALFRQGGKGEPAKVALSRKGYVYDLRNRKTLGLVKEFKTEILPNRASFFAITPQPVLPAKVNLAAAGKRGQVAKVLVSMPGAVGSHAFAVTARFPSAADSSAPRAGEFFPREGYPLVNGVVNQEKREFMKRVIVGGKEAATIDLPIAFNDPTGDYEISVKELFTNKTVMKKLVVK